MPFPTELPPALHRKTQVLLVLDVVESVRLMEQDQDNFVRRWQQLVQHAEQHILPQYGGRIVKSLGDGLMLAFASAPHCARAAFALRRFSQQAHAGQCQSQQLHLRMGGHLASFVTDRHDIYGTDVNLTSRLCSLAGPDDIVISAAFRDRLPPALDAATEDLGERYLRHVRHPVRAYRLAPPGEACAVAPLRARHSARRPTVAVMPFMAQTAGPRDAMLGGVLAGEIMAALSRRTDLQVISRLPGTGLWNQAAAPEHQPYRPQAHYVLSGACRAAGQLFVLVAQLVEVCSGRVVWADSLKSTVQEVLQGEDQITADVVGQLEKHLGRAGIPGSARGIRPSPCTVVDELCA